MTRHLAERLKHPKVELLAPGFGARPPNEPGDVAKHRIELAGETILR
ncbi:MAG: hypothetical protein ACXWCX_23640 [Burkholderiales bacterium]